MSAERRGGGLLGDGREAGAAPRFPRRRPAAGLVVLAVLLGAGALLPQVLDDPYFFTIASDGVTLGLLALAVGFLAHRSGMITLGHTAFYGSGAYVVAIGTTRLGWAPLDACAVAGLAGIALAAAIGALVVRTPGMSFVMLTLAFGQALYVLCVQTTLRPLTGAYDGLPVSYHGDTLAGLGQADLGDPLRFWPIAWVVLVVAGAALWALGRSRYGVLLEAIRENEERVRFSGYSTYLPRLAAFTISGAVATLAGILFALHHSFVSPDLLDWGLAGNSLTAAIVGGAGSVFGPPIGGVLYIVAQDRFSGGGNLEFLTGAALIAAIVLARGGITGAATTLLRTSAVRIRGRRR